MRKIKINQSTTLEINDAYEAESIERKMQRMLQNKEVADTTEAPLLYTERKEGIRPEYDIRTDRFDMALDAMSTISKTHRAKRAERINNTSPLETKESNTSDLNN